MRLRDRRWTKLILIVVALLALLIVTMLLLNGGEGHGPGPGRHGAATESALAKGPSHATRD